MSVSDAIVSSFLYAHINAPPHPPTDLDDFALELPLNVRAVQRLRHHRVELLVRHPSHTHAEGALPPSGSNGKSRCRERQE